MGLFLEKRNFISTKEFSLLIDLVKMEDKELRHGISCFPVEILGSLREAAAKAIAHFTFPEQRYRHLRKEVLMGGCLSVLLEFVYQEKIQVHRELGVKDIQFHSQVAKGGSGTIHKATYKGTTVAVKTFRNFVTEDSRIEFFRELGVCSMLQHENLITCYGAHTQVAHKDEDRFIVLAFMKRGSLYDILETEKNLSKEVRLRMALDCAKGMAYLHQQGIVHRDLKSLNLMVTEDWGLQVIDFGTSRIVDHYEMTNNLGSVFWMAPEMFQDSSYDNSVDVYAFGIVLWELLTMQKPYSNVKGWDVPKLVERGERPPVPPAGEWDDWVIKLMKKCWHQKPAKRPSFDTIISILMSYITQEAPRKSRSIDHQDESASELKVNIRRRSRSKSPSRSRRGLTEPNDRYTISVESEPSLHLPRKKKKRKNSLGTPTGYSSDCPVSVPRKRLAPSILISNDFS